jgi:hypothetical protein
MRAVPYFSQWETPELTLAVLAQGQAALRRDPAWRASGADSLEEYVTWANHVCGMACLKMVLAARGHLIPTLRLARECTTYGGYVADPSTGEIRGLIYAPFVRYVAETFGLQAEVVTDIGAERLPAMLGMGDLLMASVHPDIRWPDRDPPSRGGHLVLVLGATPEAITFHNPSGHDAASQADVVLPVSAFARFFAGRGIRIARPNSADRPRHA